MHRSRLMIRPRRMFGFTLLEVLLVVAILGVIASLVVPQLMGRQEQANLDATRLSMSGIDQALKLFALDHSGRYPTTAEGLGALVTAPAQSTRWRGPYLEALPQDAWGQPFTYQLQANRDGRSHFTLRSAGPDGVAETPDDITNERQPPK